MIWLDLEDGPHCTTGMAIVVGLLDPPELTPELATQIESFLDGGPLSADVIDAALDGHLGSTASVTSRSSKVRTSSEEELDP